jgi:hypothetical protein
MGNFWVVMPEVVRQTLTFRDREFWLDLKKELTTGEAKKIEMFSFMRGRKVEGADDVELNVDWADVVFMKVKTWIADWSLADDDKKKMPLTVESLRAMKSPLFIIIENAVDAHARSVSEEEKKVQNDESKLQKISAS